MDDIKCKICDTEINPLFCCECLKRIRYEIYDAKVQVDVDLNNDEPTQEQIIDGLCRRIIELKLRVEALTPAR